MRSVSQKRTRTMYTDLHSASGLGRINLFGHPALLAHLGVVLERALKLTVRAIREVDAFVLGELFEDSFPEIVGGRAPLAWVAEVAQREHHPILGDRRPDDGGEVHVANEVAVGCSVDARLDRLFRNLRRLVQDPSQD